MLLWLEAWRVSRRFPIALSGHSITNGECYLQGGRWSRLAVYINYFLGPLPIVSRLANSLTLTEIHE